MIKYILHSKDTEEFYADFNKVNLDSPIFDDILNRSNLDSITFIKEEKYSLNDLFQLRVNVSDVGLFHFFYEINGFDKEEIIKEISILKEIEVTDLESAINKVNKLLDIAKKYDPKFLIFKEQGNKYSILDQLEKIIGNDLLTFVDLEKDLPPQEEIQEAPVNKIVEDANPNKEKTEKKKEPKQNAQFKKDFKENKFHFLLLLVSTLLLMTSISLGILNIYAKNLLSIFLFISAAIGLVMNGLSYYDFFRVFKIKNKLFALSLVSNLIGLGLGVGGFAILFNITPTIETAPKLGLLILYGLVASILSIALVILLTYFLPKKPSKENKKK